MSRLHLWVSVGSIRQYLWSCEGEGGCFTDTFGRQTEVSFSAPGEYTVRLTVENVLGATDSVTKTIRVVGGAPVAAFRAEPSGNAARPGEFTFNAGESTNRSGIREGLTYFWSFDGDFQRRSSPTINYEFTTVGEKTVELVVVENFRGVQLRSEPSRQTISVETVLPVDFTID